MKYIILLLVYSSVTVTFAQTSKTDSLKSLLSTHTKKDSFRVNLLNETANFYKKKDIDSTYYYAQKAYDLSTRIHFPKGQLTSLNSIGFYYAISLKFDFAFKSFNESLEIAENERDLEEMARIYNNMGIIYQIQAKNNLAIETFQKSLDIRKELKDTIGISKCLNDIGNSYRVLGNYVLALEFCQEALKNFEALNDKKGIAYTTNTIGIIHEMQESFSIALEYYEKSLKFKKELGQKAGIAACLNDIGILNYKLKNYDKALKKYEESLAISQEIKSQVGIGNALSNIGTILKIKGNYIKALENYKESMVIFKEAQSPEGLAEVYIEMGDAYFERGDFSSALDYTQMGLNMAVENHLLELQKTGYEKLSKIYEKRLDFRRAYKNHILFKQITDSLFNMKNTRQITNLELQYKYDKEKQTQELLQRKNDEVKAQKINGQKKVQNFLIISIGLMVVLIIVLISSIVSKRKSNLILAEQKRIIEEDNKALTELNSTKNKFFSIIAHDLRGPLGSLYSLGEHLWRTHDNIEPKTQKEVLGLLAKEAKSTFTLLDNLLNWAVSNSGKMSYHPKQFDINELINENLAIFNTKADEKNITLKNLMEPNLMVYSDHNMLKTVVRNLLSNAIKFTERNGHIKIISADINKDNVKFGISDNGVGIDPALLPKLFDIDSKHTTLGTNSEKGSGLGLKLCKEFIEKNNGKIEVESNEGEGTIFWITLPASG